MAESDPIRKEVFINAPARDVFGFLTDADLMVRWMGQAAELNPVHGGVFRVEVTDVYVARGEFVEVVPNERVVFTWGWEGSDTSGPGTSTVEISLEERSGGTMLRLVHTGLAGDERASHDGNWPYFLDRLAAAAQGS